MYFVANSKRQYTVIKIIMKLSLYKLDEIIYFLDFLI